MGFSKGLEQKALRNLRSGTVKKALLFEADAIG